VYDHTFGLDCGAVMPISRSAPPLKPTTVYETFGMSSGGWSVTRSVSEAPPAEVVSQALRAELQTPIRASARNPTHVPLCWSSCTP
jgi:hypothetical protein